ncbi:MAG: hypothetical protein ABI169_01275 [Chitinophagaceae bacterium]
MQLFNTKVIPSSLDILWQSPQMPVDSALQGMLVLSTPFPENSEEATVLQKMMQACKLGDNNYFLKIMEADERLSLTRYCNGTIPPVVLLLGINPRQLGINAQFILNACNPFLGSTFIPSLDLGHIAYDKDLKRTLWEQGLKPMFAQK